jgi:hypothetical protein
MVSSWSPEAKEYPMAKRPVSNLIARAIKETKIK